MKQFYSFLILPIIFVFGINLNEYVPNKSDIGDEFQGAWTTNIVDENGNNVQVVSILQDSFIAQTFYSLEKKEFYQTIGGSWQVMGNEMKFNVHFDSKDAENVGSSNQYKFKKDGDLVTFEGEENVWKKIDNGNTSPLANPWFFSGRMRDGEMSRRPLRARKTMKIISDTRFQWIAYNDETGVFSGTGGGTYTHENGKYVENIEFFSRNADRVGASLSFDYEVKDGEWHHTGFSSKGDPMYEIWAPIGMIGK